MPVYAIRLKEGQNLEQLKEAFDQTCHPLHTLDDNIHGQDISFEAPAESALKLEEKGYTVLLHIG
ncbi:MAG TPA: hypothetical protein VIF12_04865 [Micavibrio sp.]